MGRATREILRVFSLGRIVSTSEATEYRGLVLLLWEDWAHSWSGVEFSKIISKFVHRRIFVPIAREGRLDVVVVPPVEKEVVASETFLACSFINLLKFLFTIVYTMGFMHRLTMWQY